VTILRHILRVPDGREISEGGRTVIFEWQSPEITAGLLNIIVTNTSMKKELYENKLNNELFLYLTSTNPTRHGIDALIAKGANVSAINKSGDDCLLSDYIFHLVNGGYDNNEVEIVRHLILKGADVNFSHDGLTPLWYACLKLKPSIVRLLIEHGANVNVIVEGDESILDYARFEADFTKRLTQYKVGLSEALEIISILEDAGALSKNEIE
jgi:hypothetical protein